MSIDNLLALMPLITISVSTLLLMLQLALYPGFRISYLLSCAGMVATLIATFSISGLLPQQVTPLLLIDRESQRFCQLVVIAALLVLPFYRQFRTIDNRPGEYLILLHLCVLGALVLACSQHLASLIIGIELISLSLVAMIAYPFSKDYSQSLESGIKYLLLSAIASAILLFGTGLLYISLGTLDFAAIAQQLTEISDDTMLICGLMMLLGGIAFKLSLAPFHLWTADLYQGAPLLSATLLATLSKLAIALVLFRLVLTADLTLLPALGRAIAALAILSMLIGNLFALFQSDFRRLLAGSSIAHLGYLMVLLLAIASQHSVEGVAHSRASEAWLFYLISYMAATLAAFAVLLHLAPEQQSFSTEQLRGLCQRHPLSGSVLLISLLSLAGIPLTAGFIAKFYIFTGATGSALWLLLLILVAGSAIGLFYYLRVVLLLVTSADNTKPRPTSLSWLSRIPVVLLGMVTLVLGIYPSLLIDLLQR